jgi:hypothetical protein
MAGDLPVDVASSSEALGEGPLLGRALAKSDGRDGTELHRLPSLSNSDVAGLVHTARVRILGFLERRGVIEKDGLS